MQRCVAVACLIFVTACPMKAQDSTNPNQEILRELREIHKLLETKLNAPTLGNAAQSQAPTSQAARVTLDVGSAPRLGAPEAPLTIVEFTDFQCPFCNRFFVETFPTLKKNFIDSGQVRFYSMDNPLEFHTNALRAAEAGRCAMEQGQFWAMHDRLQANPQELQMADILRYAGSLGLEAGPFQECLESDKYKAAIQQSMQEALRKGVRGTPTFVVGRSTAAGVEGTLLLGAESYPVFEKLLKQLSR